MGGTLRHIGVEETWVDYPIKHDLTNPVGMIQGGFLAAIIDDTIGIAFFSMEPEYMYTTNFKCQLLICCSRRRSRKSKS